MADKLCARMREYAFARDRCLVLALEEGGIEYLEEREALPEPRLLKCKCPECAKPSPEGA